MTLLQRQRRVLTDDEKIYARRFRDAAQVALTAELEANPPTYRPPNFVNLYRHLCSARPHNESTALEMKEKYVTDDIILPGWLGWKDEQEHCPSLPRFAFIYKQGKCRKCGDTATSPAGRLVLQEERPPNEGRMARE